MIITSRAWDLKRQRVGVSGVSGHRLGKLMYGGGNKAMDNFIEHAEPGLASSH